MIPRFHAFWAINGPLDRDELRAQLQAFRECGFDGVVWHPRFYPGMPPYLGDDYLAALSEIILHAKQAGLSFWIYDEDGWPSGTVGGRMLPEHPECVQLRADLTDEATADCIAEFEHGGRRWFVVERRGHGVDYFHPDFSRHFIRMTYERYRDGLSAGAWEHVEAFFCDEPEFGLGHAYDSLSRHGTVPWTTELPGIYQERTGRGLACDLRHLFFDTPESATIRTGFWELLTDIFNTNFTRTVNEWCRSEGKRFTGHAKGEEHPLFQVPTHGSSHRFFMNLDLPGIDALERDPGNDFYPRQLSSAARQFGDGRCMAEAFGGAGWGAEPGDLESYLLWLGKHGVTDFVMHLSQYRLDSAAIRDWPPSQPLHLTWRDVYPEVIRSARRELAANPRPPAELLAVAPLRGIMSTWNPAELPETNIHNAATYPDTAAGRINDAFLAMVEEFHRSGTNFDVVDEWTLEERACFNEAGVSVGRAFYRHVVIGPGCVVAQEIAGAAGKMPPHSESAALPPPPDLIEIRSLPVCWKPVRHPVNSLLLESKQEADGWFSSEFRIVNPIAGMKLVFADEPAFAVLNGTVLAVTGRTAALEGRIVSGINTLRCRFKSQVDAPFVWIDGLFRVRSGGGFHPGPEGTLKTTGPFTLFDAREIETRCLLEAGFPFLRQPIIVTAEVGFPEAVSGLRFEGVEADALRLDVDGEDLGWIWRRDDQFTWSGAMNAGRKQIELTMIPSSFNGFGPHHHFAGDPHVVSPDQFRGVKNFADDPAASGCTAVVDWHFRKLNLPSCVTLLRKT